MHKRMCFVSSRVAKAGTQLGEDGERERVKSHQTAVRELYRGQCNCAYWHGLFGGLYLAKLRSAVHGHLIRADVEASRVLGIKQPVDMERVDLDADLADEVVLTGRTIGAVVAPARGGTLLSVDDRQRAFCITDVLTRRPEAYHDKIRELSGRSPEQAAGGAPKSIHEITSLKDKNLADALVYDPHQRLAFVDQFFDAALDPEDLWRCRAKEIGDFVGAPYDLLQSAGGRLLLSRTGRLSCAEGPAEVALHKSIELSDDALRVEYELTSAGPLRSILFATELSLALPSGPHPTGRLRLSTPKETLEDSVTAVGVTSQVYRIDLWDPASGMTIVLSPSPAATVVRFPLETASQSESGFERTYQGSVVVMLWPCNLEAGGCAKPAVGLQLR
jgi:alpha-amylase